MRKMKVIIVTILFSSVFLTLFSCIHTDVKSPGPTNYNTHYRFTTDDFRVLGKVKATGEITSILGIVMYGGNGYSELLKKAKEKGGDDIIKYSFDMSYWSCLLIVYGKGKWNATATVIKYRDKALK